jgi:hypothetical protein
VARKRNQESKRKANASRHNQLRTSYSSSYNFIDMSYHIARVFFQEKSIAGTFQISN